MEAVIFCGIQASGKSTFYKERFFATHIRINLDMLKTRNRERILLEACLVSQQPFVVDKTNATAAERARYITQAQAAGFTVVGYYFRSNIKESLERNARRSGSACIPERGIFGTYHRLEIPKLEEGFDKLFYVSINEDNQFEVKEWADEV